MKAFYPSPSCACTSRSFAGVLSSAKRTTLVAGAEVVVLEDAENEEETLLSSSTPAPAVVACREGKVPFGALTTGSIEVATLVEPLPFVL